MKSEVNRLLLLVIGALTGIVLYMACSKQEMQINIDPQVEIIHDTIYLETDWSRMIGALIKVESDFNASAENLSSGAAGILQIMPIFVAEANRLSGKGFTLEDRFDPRKSLEMFEIVQAHHNPGRDIEKAIRMHNPGGKDWYYNRVIKAMEE